MSDYTSISEAEGSYLQLKRVIGQTHVALFGRILTFYPGPPQRCDVQPLTQLKVTLGDEVQYINLPQLSKIPIIVPQAQGQGLLLTVPLQQGDTVLLLVPDRGIDNFLKSKETTPPPIYTDPTVAEPRSHSLVDAIAIPGLTSDVDSVPSYNTSHIELRDKERKNYISLGADGIVMTDGQASITISGGKVTINAPDTLTATTGKTEMTSQEGTAITGQSVGVLGVQSTTFHGGGVNIQSESPVTIDSPATVIDGFTFKTHYHPTHDGTTGGVIG